MAIHLGWWAIPLAITILSVGWAFWFTWNENSLFGCLALLLCLVPALFVSALAWAIAGFFK